MQLQKMVTTQFLLPAVTSGVAFLLAAAPVDAQVTANPTRPSASDNAFMTAPGYLEVEAGLALDDNGWTLPVLLKYSIDPRIELGFLMQGLLERFDTPGDDGAELGDPGAQAKLRVVEKPWGAVAAVGRLDFPSGVSPTYTAYGVASRVLPGVQWDATLGLSLFDSGPDYDASVLYALAASRKLQENLSGYVELFGENGSGRTVVALDGGVTFNHSLRFISDASLVIGLTDDAPDWVLQVGFTSTLTKISNR